MAKTIIHGFDFNKSPNKSANVDFQLLSPDEVIVGMCEYICHTVKMYSIRFVYIVLYGM